ncbi:MAG: nucleotide sugar dehydrogenase [Candidatus Omnitrophica bacterium]|nr:nucleotide sugar dehydrogenase [Candidatus Omnitrophota bacterium]
MGTQLRDFKQKIAQKKFKIAVVGLGYVGLPLALEFAKRGIEVSGIDVDRHRISRLEKKESYITDISDKELRQVLALGHLSCSHEFSALKTADVIIICVPTPLKRKYHPNISFIRQAVKAISGHLKKGSLVILESTTYPGTTEEVILPLLEERNRKHNQDFYLSFSPERIDPGNQQYPVHKIPKIVGGLSKEATELTVLVYRNIIENVVAVSSTRVAEFVKLLENTFRLINIGMIDEMAMMAHKMGVDIWEVIKAASTKPFGFMTFYPGPGVGGHCIPKDPLYLYWKARHHGFKSRFIKLASDVIHFMPGYVVSRMGEILRKNGKDIAKSRVLVLGVTYKKDVLDLRQSPALDVLEILLKNNISVSYYDPLAPYLKMNHLFNLESIKLDSKNLKKFDCVCILTDHSSVNYDFVLKHARLIFDTRNVYKGKTDKRIVKL